MRKKSALVALCILLFLPTVLLVTMYNSTRDNLPGTSNASHMYVITPTGEEFRTQSGEELFTLFDDITRQSSTYQSLPDGVDQSSYFLVTFYRFGVATQYRYYLSYNPASSFFVGPIGGNERVYRVSHDTAAAFINSSFGISLHEHSSLPTLTIGDITVQPREIDWYFRTYGSNELTRSPDSGPNSLNPISVGDIPLSFTPNFSHQPDEITIEVRDGDSLVFNTGSLTDWHNHTLSNVTNGIITIIARWEHPAYSGQAVYVINATIHPPPTFFLAQPSVNLGELVVLNGQNVLDPTTLTITSEPAIPGLTANFFRDGDYVRMLIPIGLDLALFDDYEHDFMLTISAEGFDTNIPFTVNGKTAWAPSASVNVAPNRMPQAMANEHAAESFISNPYVDIFSRIQGEIEQNTDFTTRYWQNIAFGDGWHNTTANGALRRSNFGSFITLQSVNRRFQAHDYHFVGVSGTTHATAVNNGKVVFVGNDLYLDDFVVVCHGFGLLSWYGNLRDISVEVGDILERGDNIGRSGGGGLSETSDNGTTMSLRVALTVFGTPVQLTAYTTYGIPLS